MGTKRNLELCRFGDIYLVGLVVGGDVEWTRQHASISHRRTLIARLARDFPELPFVFFPVD
jgi:predicted TIM-barrel fold metal-dependent hydrolase